MGLCLGWCRGNPGLPPALCSGAFLQKMAGLLLTRGFFSLCLEDIFFFFKCENQNRTGRRRSQPPQWFSSAACEEAAEPSLDAWSLLGVGSRAAPEIRLVDVNSGRGAAEAGKPAKWLVSRTRSCRRRSPLPGGAVRAENTGQQAGFPPACRRLCLVLCQNLSVVVYNNS